MRYLLCPGGQEYQRLVKGWDMRTKLMLHEKPVAAPVLFLPGWWARSFHVALGVYGETGGMFITTRTKTILPQAEWSHEAISACFAHHRHTTFHPDCNAERGSF